MSYPVNLYANAMRGDHVPPGASEDCTCQMYSAPRKLMWQPEDDCPDHAHLVTCKGCDRSGDDPEYGCDPDCGECGGA